MSGIYIHIPFCKQACYYCDFHFSTSLKKKPELLDCLIKEIKLRKDELNSEVVQTIYFGGGTPSILFQQEIDRIIEAIYKFHKVIDTPEITMEVNPDDLTSERIKQLANSKVNRLSIGIQSFYERDLKLMNRAHNAIEAEKCLEEVTQHFENISIDLIYGIPNLSNDEWRKNIKKALSYGIPHISSYALTVEPKTALENFIKKGIISDVDEVQSHEQFRVLVNELTKAGFIHYELSNFGKEGYFSINNSSYWQGKSYIGIGPAAHSFDGKIRSWNIRSNSKYIKAIEENKLPLEYEVLSKSDQFNELIMIGLRTFWGVSLDRVKEEFGDHFLELLKEQSKKHIEEGFLKLENNHLKTTSKGMFLADGIASNLFILA